MTELMNSRFLNKERETCSNYRVQFLLEGFYKDLNEILMNQDWDLGAGFVCVFCG
jgi:hypothetical protein